MEAFPEDRKDIGHGGQDLRLEEIRGKTVGAVREPLGELPVKEPFAVEIMEETELVHRIMDRDKGRLKVRPVEKKER